MERRREAAERSSKAGRVRVLGMDGGCCGSWMLDGEEGGEGAAAPPHPWLAATAAAWGGASGRVAAASRGGSVGRRERQ